MTFELETEMAAPVLTWCREHGYAARCEVATNVGIVDIAAVNGAAHRLPLTRRQANTLFHFPTSVDLNIDNDDRQFARLRAKDIHHLTRLGLLRREPTGHIIRTYTPPEQDPTICIELKLSRVHDALKQARSYQEWSRRTYVALPEKRVVALGAVVLGLFTLWGVGLLAVNPSGCREVCAPDQRKAQSWHNPAMNLLLQAKLGANRS